MFLCWVSVISLSLSLSPCKVRLANLLFVERKQQQQQRMRARGTRGGIIVYEVWVYLSLMPWSHQTFPSGSRREIDGDYVEK